MEVELCRQAACRGDVEEVKKQVRQLLHERRPSSEQEHPHPTWLYQSLAVAITNRNVELVRYLLDEDVANGNLPFESAVRAQAFEVLELFLQYGWDINQPLARNEPPALRFFSCPLI
jgi:hypothetical protein